MATATICKAQRPQNREHLSEQEINNIIVLYQSGISSAKVGQQLGYPKATIQGYLRRRHLLRQPIRIHADVLQQIKKLYEEGYGLKRIALTLGINQSTAREWLRRFNINIRTQSEGIQFAQRIGAYSHPRKYRGKHGHYFYLWAPNHPRAIDKRVAEHILVWEQTHGKPLPKGWIIHHINGVSLDNRPENLVAMPKPAHRTQKQLLIKAAQERLQQVEQELIHLKAQAEGFRRMNLAGVADINSRQKEENG